MVDREITNGEPGDGADLPRPLAVRRIPIAQAFRTYSGRLGLEQTSATSECKLPLRHANRLRAIQDGTGNVRRLQSVDNALEELQLINIARQELPLGQPFYLLSLTARGLGAVVGITKKSDAGFEPSVGRNKDR